MKKRAVHSVSKASGCTIRFTAGGIVLSGAADAVHAEASKILRRFAFSGKPYEVKSDTPEQVVLHQPQATDGAIKLVDTVVPSRAGWTRKPRLSRSNQ